MSITPRTHPPFFIPRNVRAERSVAAGSRHRSPSFEWPMREMPRWASTSEAEVLP